MKQKEVEKFVLLNCKRVGLGRRVPLVFFVHKWDTVQYSRVFEKREVYVGRRTDVGPLVDYCCCLEGKSRSIQWPCMTGGNKNTFTGKYFTHLHLQFVYLCRCCCMTRTSTTIIFIDTKLVHYSTCVVLSVLCTKCTRLPYPVPSSDNYMGRIKATNFFAFLAGTLVLLNAVNMFNSTLHVMYVHTHVYRVHARTSMWKQTFGHVQYIARTRIYYT